MSYKTYNLNKIILIKCIAIVDYTETIDELFSNYYLFLSIKKFSKSKKKIMRERGFEPPNSYETGF